MTDHSGFYFPPEWAPHEATWLSWPHNTNTWPNGLGGVHEALVEFVKIVSQAEKVCIQVKNEAQQQVVQTMLNQAGVDPLSVRLFMHPTDDAWCRDHGPAFVIEATGGSKAIVNWGFNAWGGKYPPFKFDNDIPQLIGKALDIPVLDGPLILEG